MMAVACQSASSSMACSTGPDGKMKCTENHDPNGGIAVSDSQSGSWPSGKFPFVMLPGIVPYFGGKILKASCKNTALRHVCHERFQTQTIVKQVCPQQD
ncbi:hypothetical protein TNIN_398351 [Trichonephila inaurata madagascariensis]|uniref:Uncharacterized protein n=1 Tax=Trichonephila inaurata madagascariensis TaxID=2747483 RepID=A0A8X6XSJ2_9ARAC|nr:hypothetical protein TNIN_398351 [Trichonephila inaurata madagascariensis]